MGDLISRAAAIEYLMTNMGWIDDDGYTVDDADEKAAIITDLVNGIPSVDAVPMMHGRWYDIGSLSCRCTACGIKSSKISAYCPHCGAKMDGGKE